LIASLAGIRRRAELVKTKRKNSFCFLFGGEFAGEGIVEVIPVWV